MSDYGMCSSNAAPLFGEKDPDDVIDYEFNWGPWLRDDEVISAEFLLPDGLTEVSSSFSSTRCQILVGGGIRGRVYRITNRVTTVGGRTKDQTIRIRVVER